MKHHKRTHTDIHTQKMLMLMLLLLMLFFVGRLCFFFFSPIVFYSVINFLSFFFSLVSILCVCVCCFFGRPLTSEHHNSMSRSIFVVRRASRQIDREREREKWESKLYCSLLMYEETYVVGFIDICLPDNNKKGKMVNIYISYTDWPVASYDQFTCSGLVSICWISIFCIAFEDGCKYWSMFCCCGETADDKYSPESIKRSVP